MPRDIDKKYANTSSWRFEENKGQYHKEVKYVLYKGRYVFLFFIYKIFIGIRENNNSDKEVINFFEIVFDNMNEFVEIQGEDEGLWNKIYLGEDYHKARVYEKLRYRSIFKGIDLVFYIKGNEVEFDFVCYPSSDIKEISFLLGGVNSVVINDENDISIDFNEEVIKILKPKVSQQQKDKLVLIEAHYTISGNRVKFEIGCYDKEIILVIDPTIIGSTYLGFTEVEILRSCTLDGTGNYYGVGKTCSITSLKQIEKPGKYYLDYMLYVLKMNSDGAIDYYIYINGYFYLEKLSMCMGNEKLYIATTTLLETALKINARERIIIGGKKIGLCVLKIDLINYEISYINYIGIPKTTKFGETYSNSSVLCENEEILITGCSKEGERWKDVILSNQYRESGANLDNSSIFLYKINEAGDLAYFEVLGLGEISEGIKVKKHFKKGIYVSGFCNAERYEGLNAKFIGSTNGNNIFCANYNEMHNTWQSISIIGGNDIDIFGDMDIDIDGDIYIVGRTNSYDFPVYPKTTDVEVCDKGIFLLKLNTETNELSYSLKVKDEFYYSSCIYMAVDKEKNAFVTGYSDELKDLPLINESRDNVRGGGGGFLISIISSGEKVKMYSYLSGEKYLYPFSINISEEGEIFISGLTNSKDLPLINSWHEEIGSPIDTFIFKIKNNDKPKDKEGLGNHSSGDEKSLINAIKNKFKIKYKRNKLIDIVLKNIVEIEDLKLRIKSVEEQLLLISKGGLNNEKNTPKYNYQIVTGEINLLSTNSQVVLKLYNNEIFDRNFELKVKSYDSKYYFNTKSYEIVLNSRESIRVILDNLYRTIDIKLIVKDYDIMVDIWEENNITKERRPISIVKKKVE